MSTPTDHPIHPTVEQRRSAGRAARKAVPRSSHGELHLTADRPDPVALLEEQAQSRVPELVPIRYGRMLVSPFTFYRGAARVMAVDLAAGPHSGLEVQLCGDAHLANFGVFGSPERRMVFDLNDFDETHTGPFEWDVKRLVASLEIAGRDRGFSATERSSVVVTSSAAYRTAMADFATKHELEVWYARLDVDAFMAELGPQIRDAERRRAEKNLSSARAKDSLRAFNKLTEVVDGERRIISDPPLVVPLRDLLDDEQANRFRDEISKLLDGYRSTLSSDRRHLLDRYRLVDIGRKVVGVGSVGTRAWILLLLGRDDSDPLFLQAKEAQASVLEGLSGTSPFDQAGQRVVEGQRLMQASSDIFLGWQRIPGELSLSGRPHDYYIRQLADWKGSARVDRMDPEALAVYGRLCGWTLARAHARSGDRVAISGYLGNGTAFDRAMATFASSYADRNEADHALLAAAAANGRIAVEAG
jgi:uncharacterized protein (DUF2252 family)